MGNPEILTVTVTTAADGSATAYTSSVVNGVLQNIIYTKTDFAAGVDFTITAETSGLNLWTEENVNASKTVSPTQPTHTQAGAVSTERDITLCHERVKIVIASGGDTKTGTFKIIMI
jgi:hypothetical protein